MRFNHVLTLVALASSSALPATAQVSGDAERRAERRIETGYAEDHRAALGIGTSATGTLRDTLGVMITSITRNSPAERAGLEEGNRLAAINGVSLRASAADVEDAELSGTLTRRLTRELSKVRPGDEVELRVYREGRTQSLRVKTADADSLFSPRAFRRLARSDWEDRPALGFSIGSSGSRRDTLGVLVVAVADSTPAARAGIEEGNRIAAINSVNLRVAREDAGDRYLGNARAQRLQREIGQLKPGDEVTLRVYSNGQFRDVRVKAARAGDLPRHAGNMMFMGGPGLFHHQLPSMPPIRMRGLPRGAMHFELGPEIEQGLREAGAELDRMRPELDRLLEALPRTLESIRVPNVKVDVEMPRVQVVVM
jgi:hypothetical protein